MNWRVVWLGVGGVLTVVALLSGTATVWGIMQGASTETERQAESYQRPASGIDVDLLTGTVNITGQDADRVDIERELEWAHARPTIDEYWAAEDRLRADVDCPNGFPAWVGGGCSVDYAARIPSDADVDATTTTAPITVRDIGGDVQLSATTGDITGADLRSSRVEANLTTGDVDLSFAEQPDLVSIELTTGDVVLEVPRGGAYDVDIETTTGDERVDVVQDPAAPRAITVDATTADVWIRYAA